MGIPLLFISHVSPHKAIKEQFSWIYVSIQRAIRQQWISFHERDGLALPAEPGKVDRLTDYITRERDMKRISRAT
jgi:hypothetical protein